MLLAIDIGNTNVKCGLWDGRGWRRIWRAQTVPNDLADDYAVFVLDFVGDDKLHGMAISSVVPSLTAAFVELGRRHLRITPFVISARTKTGLSIALDQPEQVGSDRLANAVAVASLYGSPAIAVDLGTATKFEAIGRGGIYRGGAIAPGITLARDALIGKTALLPQVEVAPPPSPIGTNTADAVQSGTFWGYVSLVEAMIERVRDSLGEDGVQVVATGGLTPLIGRYVPLIEVYAETLTLDGIRLIYEFNH